MSSIRCNDLVDRMLAFNGTLFNRNESPIANGVRVDVLYESGFTGQGTNQELRWERAKDGFYPSHHGCIIAWKLTDPAIAAEWVDTFKWRAMDFSSDKQ